MKRTFRGRGNSKIPFLSPALIIIVAIILIVLVNAGNFIISRVTRQTITATVTDKSVKRDKDKDNPVDVYMVYTKDSDGKVYVFEDTDSIYYFKYNSSDVYAQIEVGKTYEFDVYGLRIRLLSDYQNIIKVREVD